MADAPDIRISDDEVAAYQRDGAICLRGLFNDWLDLLARGVEANMAAPGPVAPGSDSCRPLWLVR